MNEEPLILIAIVTIIGTLFGVAITVASNTLISNKTRKHQLSLAALDKRLEAHQQAYAICNMLGRKWSAQKTDRNDVQDEFITFWDNNCLYLGSASRDALLETFHIYVEFGVKGMGGTIGADFHNAHRKTLEALADEMSLPSLKEKDVSNQAIESTEKGGKN